MATTIFRVEKNREFVVMNNKFLREKEMSLKAKGLLALCLALPDDWNYSINGLCAICKESQTSIRSALKELETFYYLERKRKKDDKGQFIYEYIIYEQPYIQNQHTDNGHTDNQHIADEHTENRRQQSIKKQSIKEQSIKEQNIDNTSKKERESYDAILSSSVGDLELRGLYIEYIKMRQMIKAPLSNRALKMLITRAERLSHFNVALQKKMLEDAILNNWKSIYFPNLEKEKDQAYQSLKNFYS